MRTQIGHSALLLNKQKLKQNENMKERKKKKETYDEILNSDDLPESVNKAIRDFIQMRNLIKKPMTNRGLELLINKLKDMSQDETTQVKIVEQSVLKNWQGLYPIKEEKTGDKDSNNIFKDLYEQEGGTWRGETF